MRHKHGYRRLSRTSSHRKALFKNLAIALTREEKIETTLPKAKELKNYYDKLVTKALLVETLEKKGSNKEETVESQVNAHRAIFAMLQDKEATKKLIEEIAPKYKDRNGGYTRVIKTRIRRGDASPMAFVELI